MLRGVEKSQGVFLRRFAIGCNVLKSSQEKSKTMVLPFFWGGGEGGKQGAL